MSGFAFETQGLGVEVNGGLLLTLDQVCVVRVTLACFVSLSTMLDCLKRTTCRQQRVVSHDWTLKDVIKVF